MKDLNITKLNFNIQLTIISLMLARLNIEKHYSISEKCFFVLRNIVTAEYSNMEIKIKLYKNCNKYLYYGCFIFSINFFIASIVL